MSGFEPSATGEFFGGRLQTELNYFNREFHKLPADTILREDIPDVCMDNYLARKKSGRLFHQAIAI